MDLEDWLEEQKELDPKFTKKAFCEVIGIHPTHLSRLLRGDCGAQPRLARKIEEVTGGKVTAFDMVSEVSQHRFCDCGREFKKSNTGKKCQSTYQRL